MSSINKNENNNEPQYDSIFRFLTERLYWFAIGPMVLILLLLGLFNDEPSRRPIYSAVYLVALAGLPLSRWLEMRSGKAVTADGEPATWAHFRKYAILSVVIGVAALVVVYGSLVLRAS